MPLLDRTSVTTCLLCGKPPVPGQFLCAEHKSEPSAALWEGHSSVVVAAQQLLSTVLINVSGNIIQACGLKHVTRALATAFALHARRTRLSRSEFLGVLNEAASIAGLNFRFQDAHHDPDCNGQNCGGDFQCADCCNWFGHCLSGSDERFQDLCIGCENKRHEADQ